MKKTIIAIMTCIVFAFALTGCSGSPADTSSDQKTEAEGSGKDGEKDEKENTKKKKKKKSESSSKGDKGDEWVGLEDDTDYEKIYEPVFEQIFDAINNGYNADAEYKYVSSGLVEKIIYPGDADLMEDVGYVMEDVSKDGIPELIIGSDENYNGYPQSLIYSIFTVKDGEPFTTVEAWTRSSYSYMGDDQFYYWGSGGAAVTLMGENHLSKDGTEVEWDDFYFTDQKQDGQIGIYHNKTGVFEAEDAEELDMSEEEFSRIMDDYGKRCKQISWTPIRTMYKGGDEPAMSESEEFLEITKDVQKKLNVFLSNFAEQGMTSYDEDQVNMYEVGYFSYMWSYINRNSDVKVEGQYYTVSFDTVKRLADKYLGIKVDKDVLNSCSSPDEMHQGFFKNGNYYMPAADGESYTGLAIAGSAMDLGEGKVRVEFTVYSYDLDEYWENNETIPAKIYQMTLDEARESKSLSEISEGYAIITMENDQFKLHKYELYR